MMTYTFNFQLKGGEPVKLAIEAESYEAAFQKICNIPCPTETCLVCHGTRDLIVDPDHIYPGNCETCNDTGYVKIGWDVWRDKGYIDFIPYPEEDK